MRRARRGARPRDGARRALPTLVALAALAVVAGATDQAAGRVGQLVDDVRMQLQDARAHGSGRRRPEILFPEDQTSLARAGRDTPDNDSAQRQRDFADGTRIPLGTQAALNSALRQEDELDSGFWWCSDRPGDETDRNVMFCDSDHLLVSLSDDEGFDHDIEFHNMDAETAMDLNLMLVRDTTESWDEYSTSDFSVSSSNSGLLQSENIQLGPLVIDSDGASPRQANVSMSLLFEDEVGDVQLVVNPVRRDGQVRHSLIMNIRVLGLIFTGVQPAGSLQDGKDGIIFASYTDSLANPDILVDFNFVPPRQLATDQTIPDARSANALIPGFPDAAAGSEAAEHPFALQFFWEEGCSASLVSSEDPCGFGMLPDTDQIRIRFEQYRTGNGKFFPEFVYSNFWINGKRFRNYNIPLGIEWQDLAPPVITALDLPSVLDHNGGEQISLTGFNFFEARNTSILYVVASNQGADRQQQENIEMRQSVEGYNQLAAFITTPGLESVSFDVFAIANSADAQPKPAVYPEGRNNDATYDELEEPDDDEVRMTILFGYPGVSLLSVLDREVNGENFFRCLIAEGVRVDCNRTDLLEASDQDSFTVDGVEYSGAATNVSFRVKQNTQSSVFGNITDFISSDQLTDVQVFILDQQFETPAEDTADISATLLVALTVTAAAMLAVAGVAIQMVTLLLPAVRGPSPTSMVVAQPSIVLQPAQVAPSVPREDETLEEMALREEAEATEQELSAIASGSSNFSYRSPSANINPYTPVRVVQRVAAYGQINAKGIASPFVEVAATLSIFNFQRPAFEGTTEGPNLGTSRLSLSARGLSSFYDAYQEDLQSIFRGQIITILLVAVVLLGTHVLLYFALYKWKKSHNIAMDIIPKIEVFFFNLIYLGVFLGPFQILTTRESESLVEQRPFWFYVAAAALLILVGVGYPAFVFFVVFRKIRPNLNAGWLRGSFQRHIIRGGWRDDLAKDEKGDNVKDGVSLKVNDDAIGRAGLTPVWYKPINSWRFAGAWVHTHRIRRRYGDLFEAYKGQYYFFFFVELIILGLEGTIIGALSRYPGPQAGVLLLVQLVNLFLILWLLPYNDMIERILHIFVAALNVLVGILAVVATSVETDSDRSITLSTTILFLNITAVVVTALYCFFAFGEILWRNRADLKSAFLRCCSRGDRDSQAFSVASSLAESELSILNSELSSDDEEEKPRMIDTAVLYGGHDLFLSDGESGDEAVASGNMAIFSGRIGRPASIERSRGSFDDTVVDDAVMATPVHWQGSRPERISTVMQRPNAARPASDTSSEFPEERRTSMREGKLRNDTYRALIGARKRNGVPLFRRKANDHTD